MFTFLYQACKFKEITNNEITKQMFNLPGFPAVQFLLELN